LASVLQSPEASLHSTLGYLSPMDFEKKQLADKEMLAA